MAEDNVHVINQNLYADNQIVLFADFDSANMARYEKVKASSIQENNGAIANGTNGSSNTVNGANQQSETAVEQNKHIDHQKFDAEFNVWTRNDCQGTQYSNGNRTWFYFGVRGGHGKWVKFNIMNLNRQGRLFEMGMLPVFKTVPGHEKWSRIYSRPTWMNVDLNFQMSFCFHLPDRKGTITYFAFCFPFSYEDCQNQLTKLDKEFEYCKYVKQGKCDPDAIYYHRELFCQSLDNRRVDLLTITACNNTNFKREPRFDKNLFPDPDNLRPFNFNKKRVFVLTSRVHPGETPAQFVFNGFLEFILNKDDPRAKALRKNFVFKLIPLLNPDGVARGHYRTDQLGMNLNRVYLDPSFSLHPSIYAAKSLVVFHHIMNRTTKDTDGLNFNGLFDLRYDFTDDKQRENFDAFDKLLTQTNLEADNEFDHDNESLIENLIVHDLNEAIGRGVTPRSVSMGSLSARRMNLHEREKLTLTHAQIGHIDSHEGTQTRISHSNGALNSARSNKILLTPLNKPNIANRVGDHEHDDIFVSNSSSNVRRTTENQTKKEEGYIGNENSDEEDGGDAFYDPKVPNSPHLNDPRLLAINPLASGIAFYCDLHGHAAKRGCFIYGNSLENEAHQVENVLFTKLIAINSQHFDFDGCNFTVKNMYFKDKREGLSKEGSGRVALYKAIGLLHSYTLECNYACGRVMNTMAPAANSGLYAGRISPPQHTELPPKFLPEHYQNVGKGLAIAALDIMELNPCSRISNTTFGSLEAVRNWVKFFIRTKANGKGDKRASLNNLRNQQLANSNKTESKPTGFGGGGRRNTAPTNNTNENSTNRKYTTQMSMPAAKTSIPLRDVRVFNDSKFKSVSNVKRNLSLTEQPQVRHLVNNTPVAESKNFVRRAPQTQDMTTKNSFKSLNNNVVQDEQDFREFNTFINDNYEHDDKNSDKEEGELNEVIEILNETSVSRQKSAIKHPHTEETNWFFNENANTDETIQIMAEDEKVFALSKPSSRLQRLSNTISKGYNQTRELFPVNKAVVIHAGASIEPSVDLITPQTPYSRIGNSESASNAQVANAVAMAKQYLSRGMNSPFYQKQMASSKKTGKAQTIKAIYNTNLIKTFLNNKKQLGGRNNIKVLANTIMEQQEQLQQQQQKLVQSQVIRPTTQLDQSYLFENLDNSKGKKKALIEYNTRLSNRKTSSFNQQLVSNSELELEQYFENKKLKKRRLRDQAKKLKVSLPNIEKFDSTVKVNNEVDDVTAFWIDL